MWRMGGAASSRNRVNGPRAAERQPSRRKLFDTGLHLGRDVAAEGLLVAVGSGGELIIERAARLLGQRELRLDRRNGSIQPILVVARDAHVVAARVDRHR